MFLEFYQSFSCLINQCYRCNRIKKRRISKSSRNNDEFVFDVKIKGTTVSEQDIANARKTLKDAGINDAAYSDLYIAKVIKAASDKSLDIATVARDGKF